MDTYVGIDIHKSFSQIHVKSQEGTCMHQGRVYHDDLEQLRELFAELPGQVHVAVEATVGWMWLTDELQALGADVHLTHQKKAKAISEARLKTDSVDAQTLCQLLRTGFLPESYLAPPEVRDLRMALRYRIALVHMRIRVKNAIHAILIRYNIQHGFSDLFGKQGRQFLRALDLPAVGQRCLHGWLELLEFLKGQLKQAEDALYEQCDQDHAIQLLTTIPGIGQFTAHLILAEIGDVANFRRPQKLVAYAGLAPRVRQSAGRYYTGHTSGGRKYLKWGLIEAARTACWKDPWLAGFYRRLKKRKGAGKATVAVARKLITIVWHVLTEDRPYRPGKPKFPRSARPGHGGQRT